MLASEFNSLHEPAAELIPTQVLSTGASIPQLGFGTYLVKPEVACQTVLEALALGYRHIDTAQMYHNELEVGQALAQAADFGVCRDEVFVTTKLNNDYHERDDALRTFDQSLNDLGLDYVDLFLIHWPTPGLYGGRYDLTWQTLIEIFESGRAKAIGVSNFEVNHLQKIIDATGFVPHVNQLQAHPYFPHDDVRAYCRDLGIVVEAWAPLARGQAAAEPGLNEIAARLGKTPAQVVLRWAIERGDVIFPKTTHRDRMVENLQLFDFVLDDEAKRLLADLDRGENGRTGKHPDEANFLSR
ncbi:aldo/keto reductase [Actinomycetaceae bacterium TAE3-ERU4]|nr:aldo/keto reductase [Actinomycetaceae bacterium TAE3-ERU4]